MISRSELRLAFWGTLGVWVLTIAFVSSACTLLVVDAWWDVRVDLHHVMRIALVWLMAVLAWSALLLAEVYRRWANPPAVATWKRWALGISYYLLFALAWLCFATMSDGYFRRLDHHFSGRPLNFSVDRLRLATGMVCLYGHLFIRTFTMLWYIMATGCHDLSDVDVSANPAVTK